MGEDCAWMGVGAAKLLARAATTWLALGLGLGLGLGPGPGLGSGSGLGSGAVLGSGLGLGLRLEGGDDLRHEGRALERAVARRQGRGVTQVTWFGSGQRLGLG